MSDSKAKDEGLALEDELRFRCGPGVACFNECCQDVTIFLGPYDVMRLRRALGITASELVDKYATVVTRAKHLIPLVNLKMNDEDRRCPFVSEKGCSVYQSRPWACRMFPVDVAGDGKHFRLVIGEDRCRGLGEDCRRPVRDYLDEQGTPKFQVMDDLLGELVNDERFRQLDVSSEQVQRMVFMVLYDLDELRKFVFETSFLDKFEVDPRRVERLRRDDEELLRFGFEWLHFGLLGKKVLKVRDEALEAARDKAVDEEPSR